MHLISAAFSKMHVKAYGEKYSKWGSYIGDVGLSEEIKKKRKNRDTWQPDILFLFLWNILFFFIFLLAFLSSFFFQDSVHYKKMQNLWNMWLILSYLGESDENFLLSWYQLKNDTCETLIFWHVEQYLCTTELMPRYCCMLIHWHETFSSWHYSKSQVHIKVYDIHKTFVYSFTQYISHTQDICLVYTFTQYVWHT